MEQKEMQKRGPPLSVPFCTLNGEFFPPLDIAVVLVHIAKTSQKHYLYDYTYALLRLFCVACFTNMQAQTCISEMLPKKEYFNAVMCIES